MEDKDIVDNQEENKDIEVIDEVIDEEVIDEEVIGEEMSVREILNSDMTPTSALNFIVSGVQIALEGDFYDLEDKLILEKALGILFDQHQKGEDFIIKVK